MTKQEQNDIIKRVWTEHLQRKDNIPESLADQYSIWLRTKIREAVPQLSAAQQGGMDNSAEGEAGNMQPPPDQGGGPAPMPDQGQPPMPEGGAA